jgi:hypothetical protein
MDPMTFRYLAILVLVLSSLNLSAQSSKKDFVGKFERIVIDHVDSKGLKEEIINQLVDEKTQKARILKDRSAKALEKLNSGDRVRVKGNLRQQTQALEEVEVESVELLQSEALLAPANVVNRRVLNTLVHFQDADAFISEANARTVLRNNKSFFNDTTHGKVQMLYDEVGGEIEIRQVRIDALRADACSPHDWRTKAVSALQAQGVTTSSYNHIVLFLAPNSCTWAGLGTLGALRGTGPYTSWVKSESGTSPRVTAHELGHNLGLHHASTDANNDRVVDSEYADASSFMGLNFRAPNGLHSINLANFEEKTSGVRLATSSETAYQISALDLNPQLAQHAQVVRVVRDPSINNNFYFLSYRRRVGTDSNLSTTYTDGVSIHSATGTRSLYITTLKPGQTFSDQFGVVIQMMDISQDTNSINVFISQGNNVVCNHLQPTLATASAVTMGVEASQNVSLSVTNNDSSFCDSSTFDLSARSSNSALVAQLSSSTLTLAPGETRSVSVALRSGTTLGSFSVALAAQSRTSQQRVERNVRVDVVDGTPSVPANLSFSTRGKNLSLNWSASSSIVGIAAYEVRARIGTSIRVLGTTSSTSLGISVPSETTAYSVIAISTSGQRSQASAEAIYTVDSTTSDGGGTTKGGRKK